MTRHMRSMRKKTALLGPAEFRQLERVVMLQTVDNLWKDHLLSMDHLKEGIGTAWLCPAKSIAGV